MLYLYKVLADETEVTHSHFIEQDGTEKIIVHFERPTENGFDSARCVLPKCEWISNDGYSDAEICEFEKFLKTDYEKIKELAIRKWQR